MEEQVLFTPARTIYALVFTNRLSVLLISTAGRNTIVPGFLSHTIPDKLRFFSAFVCQSQKP
jgi:hypothetical protein